MKKLMKYFEGNKIQALCAPFFKIIEAIFELFVPFVVASIIDNGIPSGDKGYIALMCGVLVLLAVLGLLSTLAAQYFAAKASVGFACKLRQGLFDHVQILGFAEIDKLGVSTLITRLTSDVNQVQTGLNLTLRLLMRSPFIVFGAMIMAFTIDVRSALIFCVVIPVLAVIVFGIMLSCIPLYKKVQTRLDSVQKVTREGLKGARVIRAFCKEKEEEESFSDKNELLTGAQLFVGKISAIMNPVTLVVINLGIIALIHIGAIKVEDGVLTQGMVIALYNYMSQILVELVKLANLIINMTKSFACADRISKIFDISPSIVEGNITSSNNEYDYIVEYNDVSFKYPEASEESLTKINFKLKKGEKLGVIGSTGCGKTTLINLLPRFYDVTEGEVIYKGENVKNYTNELLCKEIGVVMQKAVMFKGTVSDNVKFGKKASDEEVIEALKLSQSYDFVMEKPDGIEYLIEQNGRNLSGGQKQRLSIARALLKKPEVLILDDSSSALDFATDLKLRSAISSLEYCPAVIVVSQRVASVMHLDKILVLEDGEAVGLGTHEELMESCSEYREIYDSQIKEA